MPRKPDKPHRMRVRTLDGKPRDEGALNKLKSNQLGMPHLDIVRTSTPTEFIICASKEAQIEQARAKLRSAGLEEIEAGDTTIPVRPAEEPSGRRKEREAAEPRGGQRWDGRPQRHPGRPTAPTESEAPDLSKKPYAFVALPEDLTCAPPVWHDGTSTAGRLSGEIRLELKALTPLLVGWNQQQINDSEDGWAIPNRRVSRNDSAAFLQQAARTVYPDATDGDPEKRRRNQSKVEEDRRKYSERVQDHIVEVQWKECGLSIDSKSVLCPLRAPWGKRPVIIPGDTLKGLLRHELGALLGAPMERVAERSYSYRPNAMYPVSPRNRFLVPRLARVLAGHVEMRELIDNIQVRVPTRLELFPATLEYNKKANRLDYRFDQPHGAPYQGGLGAGQQLNSKTKVHTSLKLVREPKTETADVPQAAQDGYLATLRHLVDIDHGHFSERHPDVPKVVTGDEARKRILEAAKGEVFQPGDLIWVEWDTEKSCIVSLGWHYYYRWAYTDTVRKDADAPRLERHGLFPLEEERALDGTDEEEHGAPKGLSAIRRLFGYTGDNEGSAGIGKGDFSQLMGRVSVNAALEVVDDGDTEDKRFLPPTFLRELGMPRPSAVEFYLKQPSYPNSRPSDRATLVTYGDAAGYDKPGELAGRKFYLDCRHAYSGEPWKDDSEANRANERSTLALEASRPGRCFCFTIRFRDLDPAEVAAVVVALCPHQFRELLGGTHTDGYCSKLGYARPLGWGSVRIEAKQLLWLDASGQAPVLKPEIDLATWVAKNHLKTTTQDEWLAIHCCNHPSAADYPRARDRDGSENIYTFHTSLRAQHSRARRYRQDDRV
jgi:CRISPR-associated protein (TIGR03986 family)